MAEPAREVLVAASDRQKQTHPEGSQRPGGKLGVLLESVARPEGATLGDLTAASGWLPHTARAALTRLRQRGYDVAMRSITSMRFVGGTRSRRSRWPASLPSSAGTC